MNILRLTGDLSHLLAIAILLLGILMMRSCAGVSGKSQILFSVVYITRYLDLFTIYISQYNSVMKIVFIGSSLTTIYLIYVQFRDTNDTDKDSFPIEILLIPCTLLALFVNHDFTCIEVLWTFSIYLESVAILPQFFVVGKTGKLESIVSYYLFAMGSYRAWYLVNWYYRYVNEMHFDLIPIVAGMVQTILYCIFFCYYMIKVVKGKNLANNLTIAPLPPISIIENLKEKEASQINM